MAETFDPRDLISPPWTTCPKCGKGEFGIGMIGGSRFMRRCRDCWHKEHYELPKLKKKIIYLDQFVISDLMKLNNPAIKGHETVAADPFWSELNALLFQLRHLQMICCPDSHCHVEESRTAPFNAELKKMYEALSGGITFDVFDSINCYQIGELVSAWAEGRKPVFDFDPHLVLSKDPHEWNERIYIVMGDNPFVSVKRLRRVRADLHAEISRLFFDVWQKEKRTFKYWYDLERFSYQRHLYNGILKDRKERAEAMLAYCPDAENSLAYLDKMLPSSAESLLAGIRHILRFPKQGGVRSAEDQGTLEIGFWKANRIAEAPFVRLQSIMFAAIAMHAAQGQKHAPNEGTTTDIDIVAHLLPYCDAMFMDNGCRALLLNTPKAFRPPETAKVFSLNVKAQFLDYLRSIRSGISAEHVHAIREVYGDDHLEGLPAVVLSHPDDREALWMRR